MTEPTSEGSGAGPVEAAARKVDGALNLVGTTIGYIMRGSAGSNEGLVGMCGNDGAHLGRALDELTAALENSDHPPFRDPANWWAQTDVVHRRGDGAFVSPVDEVAQRLEAIIAEAAEHGL